VRNSAQSTICLNTEFATTKLLVTEKPAGLAKLPMSGDRKGQGGLRARGYFKTTHQDKPLITVVTVVYNGREHLEDTISSVISQVYDNIEYIIIDGGSTEGTLDLIRAYDDCIDYWVRETDDGLYDAMNKGWQLAGIESTLLFLGAGDRILKFPTDFAKHKSRQVIYGQVQLGTSQVFKSRANFELKFANTLHHQAQLVPKVLHAVPPFDTRYKLYADFDFNQRLLKKGVTFLYEKEFVTYAMPGGASELYSIEACKIAAKNFGPVFGVLACLFYIFQRFKRLIKKSTSAT